MDRFLLFCRTCVDSTWALVQRTARGVGRLARFGSSQVVALTKSPRLRALVARVRRLSLAAGLGALLALGTFGVLKLIVHRVPPASIGVRQARFGTGIGDKDYGPSLTASALDRWYHIDGRTQEVRFAWESEGGTRPALEVVTRDGESVSVAAGVLYSIAEGGARKLVAGGLGQDFPARAEAIARRVLAEEFQTLGAEDWFDPEERRAVAGRALARLDGELSTCFLEAEEVVVSGVYFPPTFEKKRLQLQLDAQGRKTSEALARRRAAQLTLDEAKAEHDATLARATETWNARVTTVEIEAAAAIRTIQLEAERRVVERTADAEDRHGRATHEGKLALTAASGLRDELQAGIWAGPGGNEYLAAEAARKLTFGEVTLDSRDPGVPHPLDLDGMTKLLLGSD